MKETLETTLEAIIKLLEECQQLKRALWFREKLIALEKASPTIRKSIMLELNQITAGMGSFADLPLYPSKDSQLTQREVEVRQWELADKLGCLTR